jgi:hypothetical protein
MAARSGEGTSYSLVARSWEDPVTSERAFNIEQLPCHPMNTLKLLLK